MMNVTASYSGSRGSSLGHGRAPCGRGEVGAAPGRAGGTGSGPPGFHGWQRPSRRTASQLPRSGTVRAAAPRRRRPSRTGRTGSAARAAARSAAGRAGSGSTSSRASTDRPLTEPAAARPLAQRPVQRLRRAAARGGERAAGGSARTTTAAAAGQLVEPGAMRCRSRRRTRLRTTAEPTARGHDEADPAGAGGVACSAGRRAIDVHGEQPGARPRAAARARSR